MILKLNMSIRKIKFLISSRAWILNMLKYAQKLFNIFNNPKNFLDLAHKEIETENEIEIYKEFYGYNEIDLSLSLSEDEKLKENFTFNIVKEKTEIIFQKHFHHPKKATSLLKKIQISL